MARLRHNLKTPLDPPIMVPDDEGADPNCNAHTLLIDLFRRALAGDADAIAAMHTVVDMLGSPRGGIIVIMEE